MTSEIMFSGKFSTVDLKQETKWQTKCLDHTLYAVYDIRDNVFWKIFNSGLETRNKVANKVPGPYPICRV